MTTELVEEGEIYFFYRNKIDVEQAKSRDDVQRMYVVLVPDSEDKARMFVVGKKRLPAVDPDREDRPESERREWMMAEWVARPTDMGEGLAPQSYETKTRGTRTQPEAVPAGEGRYVLLGRERDTELAYRLDRPETPGRAQKELGIHPSASYVISVRNPAIDVPGFPESRPDYPKYLRERFAEERWLGVDHPRFLDYESAQFVLIGARTDLSELGIEVKGKANLFKRLGLNEEDWPTEALEEGKFAKAQYKVKAVSPAGDPSKGGRRGGAKATESPSAAGIAAALKGVDFPKRTGELIDYAKDSDADEDVIHLLEDLPKRKFNNMADVQKTLGEVR